MFSKFHKIFDSLTTTEREIFQGAFFIFLLSLVLVGANAFYRGTTVEPVGGGTYTEGVVGQPVAINPILTGSNDPDRDLEEILFANLTTLADTIKSSDGGRVWSVSLKPGLVWSDGNPITSDDIVFTLARIQDADTRSPLYSTWQGVTIERLGEREVRFSLKTPYAFFKDNLSEFKIVPAHIFQSIPGENMYLSDYNLEPVRNGPFIYQSFEKQKDGFIDSYTLVANPNYTGTKPLIQTIVFRFYTTTEDAIAAFNHREIDGVGSLSPADLANITVVDEVHEIKIPRYYAIFTNQNTAAPLKSRSVRLALATATDRASLISRALGGRGIPIVSPIYPGLPGYDESIASSTSFSIDDANKILDDAGWTPGQDGIRAKKVGTDQERLAFEMVVPDIPFLVDTAKILETDWQKIGVQITLVVTNPQDIANNAIKSRDYQLLLFGNVLRENPDIFSFWHSSEQFYPGLNLSLYSNKTVDRDLELVRAEPDPQARIALFQKIQSQILTDMPAVFLFSPSYIYTSREDLGGFNDTLITSPSNRFQNVSGWYLKTARIFK